MLLMYIWLNIYCRSSLTCGMLAQTKSIKESVESAFTPVALCGVICQIVWHMLPGGMFVTEAVEVGDRGL